MSAAYDYDAQAWRTGAEGDALRLVQIGEELALLESAEGSRYAAFIAVEIADCIGRLRAERARLEAKAGAAGLVCGACDDPACRGCPTPEAW